MRVDTLKSMAIERGQRRITSAKHRLAVFRVSTPTVICFPSSRQGSNW